MYILTAIGLSGVFCSSDIASAVQDPAFNDQPFWAGGFDGHQQQYFLLDRFLGPLGVLQTERLTEFEKRLDALKPRFQASRGFVDLLTKDVDPTLRLPEGLFRKRLDLQRNLEAFGKDLLKTQTKSFVKLQKSYDELLNSIDSAEVASSRKFGRTSSSASDYVNSRLARLATLTKQTTSSILAAFNAANKTTTQTASIAGKQLKSSLGLFNKRVSQSLRQVDLADEANNAITQSTADLLRTVNEGAANVQNTAVVSGKRLLADSAQKVAVSVQTASGGVDQRLQGQAKQFNTGLDKVALGLHRNFADMDGKMASKLKQLNDSIDSQRATFRTTIDSTVEAGSQRLLKLDESVKTKMAPMETSLNDSAAAYEAAARQSQMAHSEISSNFRQLLSLSKSEATAVQTDLQNTLVSPAWSSSILQRSDALSQADAQNGAALQASRAAIQRSGVDAELTLGQDGGRAVRSSENVRQALQLQVQTGQTQIRSVSQKSIETMKKFRASREAALNDEQSVLTATSNNVAENQRSAAAGFSNAQGSRVQKVRAAIEESDKLAGSRFAAENMNLVKSSGEQMSKWGVIGNTLETVNRNMPVAEIGNSMDVANSYTLEKREQMEDKLNVLIDLEKRPLRKRGAVTRVPKTGDIGNVQDRIGKELAALKDANVDNDTEVSTSSAAERDASQRLQGMRLRRAAVEQSVASSETEYATLRQDRMRDIDGSLDDLTLIEADSGPRLANVSSALLESVLKDKQQKEKDTEDKKLRYAELLDQVRSNISTVEQWHQNMNAIKADVQRNISRQIETVERATADLLETLPAQLARTSKRVAETVSSINDSAQEFEIKYNESETAVISSVNAKLSTFASWLSPMITQVDMYVNQTRQAVIQRSVPDEGGQTVSGLVNATRTGIASSRDELDKKMRQLREESSGANSEMRDRLQEIDAAGNMFTTDDMADVAETQLVSMGALVDSQVDGVMNKVTKARNSRLQPGGVNRRQGEVMQAVVGGVGSIGVDQLNSSLAEKQQSVEQLVRQNADTMATVTAQKGAADLLTGEQMETILNAMENGVSEKIAEMSTSRKINGQQIGSVRQVVEIFTNLVESGLDEQSAEMQILGDSSTGLSTDIHDVLNYMTKLVEEKQDQISRRSDIVKKSAERERQRIEIEEAGIRETLNIILHTVAANRAKYQEDMITMKELFTDLTRDADKRRNAQLSRLSEWIAGEEASFNGIIQALFRRNTPPISF